MSAPILGTFKFRPVGDDDEPSILDLSGPLRFEEAVALLVTDYGARLRTAHIIAINATKNGRSMLVNPLTHQAVRILYSP